MNQYQDVNQTKEDLIKLPCDECLKLPICKSKVKIKCSTLLNKQNQMNQKFLLAIDFANHLSDVFPNLLIIYEDKALL